MLGRTRHLGHVKPLSQSQTINCDVDQPWLLERAELKLAILYHLRGIRCNDFQIVGFAE
jgi:hypothetical protein